MNASQHTREFIEKHPYIKLAVKKGIVNYSALARLIKSKKSIDASRDALVVAIRRYAEKTAFGSSEKEKVIALLKKSRLEVKNRIYSAVFTHRIPLKALLKLQKEASELGEPFHLTKGTSSYTVVTSEEFSEKISSLKPFTIKEQNGLVEIIIKSPKGIENTLGVVSYLFSLFAERGINIVETTSCWTDTIFVISKKDLEKALKILHF